MLYNVFEQHLYFSVLSIIGLVFMFLLYRYFRTRAILEKPERHVWDLALFPAISRLFWFEERVIVIVIGLLILIAILALITDKSELWDLFKVNLGVVIGVCVRWAEHKIQQKGQSGSPAAILLTPQSDSSEPSPAGNPADLHASR